ncbi:MAG: Transducin (beta)-like 3 [Icmadophila ericetorum]|nr:Transducin (beta)-like 3 [Icmadophila ericetorum]
MSAVTVVACWVQGPCAPGSDHFSAVTSLSFTAEGDRLLTAARDKVAILWDLASHKKLATIPVYEAIEGAAILPLEHFKALDPAAFKAVAKSDGAVVFATGGERGLIKLWRSDTGQCILEQRWVNPADAKLLNALTVTASVLQVLWDGLTTPMGSLAPAVAGEEITDLQLMPGNRGLLAATGDCHEVTDLRLLGPPEAPTHLALATNSPAVRIFDVQTLNCTATLAGHTDTVLVMDAVYNKGGVSGAHDATF